MAVQATSRMQNWRSGWDDDQSLDAALDAAERAADRLPPEDRAGLPAGIDDWSPGPALAAFLAGVDPAVLPGDDRIRTLRAYTRLVNHMQAGVYRTISSITDAYRELLTDDPEGPVDEEWVWRGAESEIRAALRLTRRAAAMELGLAEDLRHRLPRVATALADGTLDRQRARVMVSETCHLSQEAARQAVDDILDAGAELTTSQVRRRLRRLAAEVEPEEARDRFERAHEERRVAVEGTSDGTADLIIADVSPDRAMSAADYVDRLARCLKGQPGESRTLDQLRADVSVDLLNGQTPEMVDPPRPGGRTEIQVDLATLAELSNAPGELAGFGPVIADIARQVALAGRSWDFTVFHPDTGEVVHTGVTRRRPTAAQARAVRARYPTCTFPGCLMPAHLCDLDHLHPHGEGGPTEEENLGPGCRYDHVNRHRLGWTYVRTPDGDHLWTSPLGFRTTTSGRPP